MKRLLSLFDMTGRWPSSFQENGWDILHVDIQNWLSIDVNSITSAEECLEVFGDVDGIFAAPPCTDYAVSGAKHWAKKDADGRTELSNELVRQVLRIVDLYWPTDLEYDGTFFYAIENPVGRMGKIFPELGKPRFYFDPCDYALWNNLPPKELLELDRIRAKNGQGITRHEADLIYRTESYTKRTGLWGQFAIPEKRRIEPVKGSPFGTVLMRAGGKSQKTKNFRSATPAGFSRAFYEANKDWRPATWEGGPLADRRAA